MIDINLHCSSCGADVNNLTLEENLEAMKNCTNCIADLKTNGKWTGNGYRIMTFLVEKHGIDVVRLTEQKLKFEKI